VLYVVYRLSTSMLGPTTTATLVAASFQFTLVLRNPSARSSVRYETG
jgi:hypothetical protein